MPDLHQFGLPAALLSLLTLSGCDGEVTIEDGHEPPPAHNVVSVDASITGYDWEAYGTYVPHGTHELVVDLHHLSEDADLYVESPDGAHACESLLTGTHVETCAFDYPQAGDWYVEVFGWEYDALDYTLTVSLWPSDLEASLWWIESVTTHAAQTLTLQQTTVTNETAQRLLPIIKSGLQRARALPTGETAFRVLGPDGGKLGTISLEIEAIDHRSAVHVKAVLSDPESGARHVVQSDPARPVLISDYGIKPEDGQLRIRRKGRETTVRLGAAAGTGADVQLVSQPGPVVTELAWETVRVQGLSLTAP